MKNQILGSVVQHLVGEVNAIAAGTDLCSGKVAVIPATAVADNFLDIVRGFVFGCCAAATGVRRDWVDLVICFSV